MTFLDIVMIVVASLIIMAACLIIAIVASDLDHKRRTKRILDRKYGQR